MELGLAGRGEHAEIMAFVGRTVDSELSGNMIDVCPVGALTSKPFRYSARTWELSRRKSIAPHDSLGSNIMVQVKQGRVMRVLPLENEEVNECWLSDRDRFSYEGLNSPQRLGVPMIKREGAWQEVDWPTALEHAAAELKRVRDTYGATQMGALAAPHSTLEELYLLGKLARGLGSGNVDFRLRQVDFSADGASSGAPWLGMKVAELDTLERVLVIGSVLRKEQPLLAHRIRQAVRKGAQLSVLNPVDDELLTRVHARSIVAPAAMPAALAQIVKAVAQLKGRPLPAALAGTEIGPDARKMAESLASAQRIGLFLGNLAAHHPQRSQLHALCALLADALQARFGFFGEAANSVGGYLAQAWPGTAPDALNARAMLERPRKGYVLLHAEIELDTANPRLSRAAMSAAECVIALSPYKHRALEYAQVLLPIVPFTETAGSFINTEGRMQRFEAVARPLAQARPAWKVLRVLGNLLGLEGFAHETVGQVHAELTGAVEHQATRLDNAISIELAAPSPASTALERMGEVPIYHADAIVRRAPSLQQTRDARVPVAWLHGSLIDELGLGAHDRVRVRQDGGECIVGYARDDRLPSNCVRLPAACPETAHLGASFGPVSVERVAVQERVSA
jgi:NADH-quinone oxidoreductase subunit G